LYSAAVSFYLIFMLGLNPPANARQPVWNAQQPEAPSSPSQFPKLAAGTPVHLRFAGTVTSSRVIAGEKVSLEAVDPVIVGDRVVISPKALAEATVTIAQANRTLGGGGRLELKIESVRLADGEIAALRAIKDVKAANEPTVLAGIGAAGLMYLAGSPVTFLFIAKGKSATIPAGSQITAYVADEIPLDVSKFQAAPDPAHQDASR
jgi:hypothetical protein